MPGLGEPLRDGVPSLPVPLLKELAGPLAGVPLGAVEEIPPPDAEPPEEVPEALDWPLAALTP